MLVYSCSANPENSRSVDGRLLSLSSVQSVENCVCILRNLSYHVHKEVPGAERFQEPHQLRSAGHQKKKVEPDCPGGKRTKGWLPRLIQALLAGLLISLLMPVLFSLSDCNRLYQLAPIFRPVANCAGLINAYCNPTGAVLPLHGVIFALSSIPLRPRSSEDWAHQGQSAC